MRPRSTTRRSTSALGLALAVALTGGCGDAHVTSAGDAPTIPEANLASVPAFPAEGSLVRAAAFEPQHAGPGAGAEAGSAEQGAALPDHVAVAGVKRDGPTDRPTRFEIAFNQPMRTFSGVRPASEDAPFVLRPLDPPATCPPVDGALFWSDDRTLVFEPAAPLPLSTHFGALVRAGSEAAAGGALGEDYGFDFTTTRLAVRYPSRGTSGAPIARAPGDVVVVEFNLPVRTADVARLATLVVSDSHRGLVSGPRDEVPLTVRAVPHDAAEATRFELAPTETFRQGGWYRLTLPRALAPATPHSLGLGDDHVTYLRGPLPLAVTYGRCGHLFAECTPGAEWTFGFNNPLDAKRAARCVSASPAIDLGEIRVGNHHLSLSPEGARAGTTYTVTLSGCADVWGSKLARTSYTFDVVKSRPQLRMAEGTGYLEPSDAGEAIAIELGARNTGPLTVRKTRLTRDTLPAFIESNLEEFGGWSFGKDVEGATETTLEPGGPDGELVSAAVVLDDALGADQRGVVFVEVEAGHDHGRARVIRRAVVQVTDTALTVKAGPQDVLLWATRLSDGGPIADASVELLDRDGASLWRGRTDASGLARAEGVGTMKRPPRLALASAGGDDLSFVDLKDWNVRVEPYRFGLPFAWEARGDRVRGYVFTERGVYRAGETVHVKGYLRLDRGRALEALPTSAIEVSVADPTGYIVHSVELTLGDYGDFAFELPLAAQAPLGSYAITVTPGGDLEGTAAGRFRVEAYRPNRFEVTVADATHQADGIHATVSGRYLYGAPMSGAPVRWWAYRSGYDFRPRGFDGYAFSEAPDGWWWEPDERAAASVGDGSGELDAEGRLSVAASLGDLDLSSGPQRLTLEAEVTDVDEQVVTGRASVVLHPADLYVGLSREGSLGAVGEPLTADVIAVSPDGVRRDGDAITVSLVKRSWRSVKKASAGGGTTWVSERVDDTLKKTTIRGDAGGPISVSFTPADAGLYLIEAEARDAAGRVTRSSIRAWVWGGGDAWWARRDDERLGVVGEAERYAVGDTARFMIQSPFEQARALVTVERQGVIWERSFEVHGGAPLIEIPVTAAMQPNAFVSVVLVRGRVDDAASGGVDHGKPASKIGYARFGVDLSDKTLTVGLSPERTRYRPGETASTTLTLTDHAGRPTAGQVAFFAVDEGVLQLTGYRTPDPLSALFTEQPLAVSTIDARRRLWEHITPSDEGMKSDWGGGGDDGEATTYRSEFATTAVFLPSVEVDADGMADVTFELPDNLGAFRLMAVAVADGNRFGRAEARIEVSKPLLVRPGLPRFLSAGDEVEARAVLQALEAEGEVEVQLEASGPVEILGEDTVALTLDRHKAEPVSFRVRALAPGEASFAFRVRRVDADEDADAVRVALPVHYPASVRSRVETGKVTDEHGVAGVTARRIEVPRWVREDVGGLEVELAPSALGELLPGLDYLVRYPYGCVEQTTGGTLPLLALQDLLGGFELPGMSRDKVLARAQAGLDRLQAMQTYSGGLGYWPGDDSPHPWGSVYGGMALVLGAKLDGITVRPATLEALTRYLRSVLQGQVTSDSGEWAAQLRPVEPFAAWVLALAGSPDHGYNARLFETREDLPTFAKAILALALAEAGGDAAMTEALLAEIVVDARVEGDEALIRRPAAEPVYGATMDTDVRTSALVLMALLEVAPEHALVDPLARGILGARRDGRWLSTQDNGFAILAMSRYFAKTEAPGASYLASVRLDGEVWLSERLESGTLTPKRITIPMATLAQARGKLLTITREGADAPLYYSLRFDYVPDEIPRVAVDRGFAISRTYTHAEGDSAGEPATSVKTGDLVKVSVSVTTPEARRYVAIDDPLPAGFEPVDPSLDTTSARLRELLGEREGRKARNVFSYVAQQDDRVTIFANNMPAGTHTHVYLARATTAGDFVVPAARVHEMYEPDVFGQATATRVAVAE